MGGTLSLQRSPKAVWERHRLSDATLKSGLRTQGEWIRGALQVRDEANEAFLVAICKSLLLTLQRQQAAAEGLGRAEQRAEFC